jgi:hypothetical protein
MTFWTPVYYHVIPLLEVDVIGLKLFSPFLRFRHFRPQGDDRTFESRVIKYLKDERPQFFRAFGRSSQCSQNAFTILARAVTKQ